MAARRSRSNFNSSSPKRSEFALVGELVISCQHEDAAGATSAVVRSRRDIPKVPSLVAPGGAHAVSYICASPASIPALRCLRCPPDGPFVKLLRLS